ncbi:hypothetical protein QFC22_002787 [Naganishia vaughanmartiniae]|uniref:Uncharacterized protein n=1 Tax=Naganishia vaughanmartiniae TaxID=1424756 RepID=A0ACC2XAN6_9TREE|nr:hypothetical protein QFC22_002787 [Naganishia vaughanmartiniae]
MSFNGAPMTLATFPFEFAKSARTHHRTPSLSSTSSATISSTEEELPTDNEATSASPGHKVAEIGSGAEDAEDIHYVDMPKTPMASAMTPTTPTDRFTMLSVCARRIKGDRFLPKRLRSSGTLRDDFHGLAGMSPRSVSAPVYDPPASPSPLSSVEPKMLATVAADELEPKSVSHSDSTFDKAESVASRQSPKSDEHPAAIRKVSFGRILRYPNVKSRPNARHQPYTSRQPSRCPPSMLWPSKKKKEDQAVSKSRSLKLKPKLSMESLPPALKEKLDGEDKQWLLVGPGIARHLQMGGSVLVRDFAGNAVGWMT